ncbi:hypothetical protein [Candidatus Avelusimicrobium facis]|uniref:hypothetical protein n=1 Tax=Candidatus Avelusimicrobium facis TaxID=3416203 RepID=UPI0015B569F8
MATAKTIQQLDPATGVSLTDQLALAQATGQEARRGSVSQLVGPVAEALSTGALAELEYATSQGKNAIATALTNKGVQSTAADTLIQMADKVNNLEVDTTTENIVGCLEENYQWYQDTQYTTAVSAYDAGIIAMCNASTLYIFERSNIAEYKKMSFNDLIATASATYTFETPYSSAPAIYISQNGTGIFVIDGNKTNMGLYFWDKEASGRPIIYEGQVLKDNFSQISYSDKFVVSDDASLIAVKPTGNDLFVYSHQNATKYTVSINPINPIYSAYEQLVPEASMIKSEYIFCTLVSTDYSKCGFTKVPYSKDSDGVITFDSSKIVHNTSLSNSHYANGTHRCLGKTYNDIIFCLSDTNVYSVTPSTNSDGFYNVAMTPVFIDTNLNISTATKNIRARGQLSTGGYTKTRASVLCIPSKIGDNIQVSPMLSTSIIYDTSTKNATVGNNISILIPQLTVDTEYIILNYGEDNEYVYLNMLRLTHITSSEMKLHSYKIRKNQLLMKLRKTLNNATTFFMPYSYTEANVSNGKYDYNTTITPAVPDEA